MKNLSIRNPQSAIRNRAYTLIEMLVSLGSATVLMTAMGSTMFIAAKSMESGTTADTQENAAVVQATMMQDIRDATGFTTRTADTLVFTVPDRTGDGNEDTITYAYNSGTKEVTYKLNDGTTTVVLENVNDFVFQYMERTMTGSVTPPPNPDSAEWGERWAPETSKFGYEDQYSFALSLRRFQIATKVTLPEAGRLMSISAYLTAKNNDEVRFAIFDHNTVHDQPNKLIVETDNPKIGSTGWHTLEVTPTELKPGTYWLALSYDDDDQAHHIDPSKDAALTHMTPVRAADDDGFTTTWPEKSSSSEMAVSIYGTYQPLSTNDAGDIIVSPAEAVDVDGGGFSWFLR